MYLYYSLLQLKQPIFYWTSANFLIIFKEMKHHLRNLKKYTVIFETSTELSFKPKPLYAIQLVRPSAEARLHSCPGSCFDGRFTETPDPARNLVVWECSFETLVWTPYHSAHYRKVVLNSVSTLSWKKQNRAW